MVWIMNMVMYGSARSINNAGAIVASDEPWVGIPEVTAHLHVSTDTAYRWVDTQGLTAHRVGRLFRFRLPQIDVWVQSRGGGIPATKSPSSPARDNGDRSANDVPIHDSAVRLAFFKEVGQREDFLACLEHDFTGANARARRIDERRCRSRSRGASTTTRKGTSATGYVTKARTRTSVTSKLYSRLWRKLYARRNLR